MDDFFVLDGGIEFSSNTESDKSNIDPPKSAPVHFKIRKRTTPPKRRRIRLKPRLRSQTSVGDRLPTKRWPHSFLRQGEDAKQASLEDTDLAGIHLAYAIQESVGTILRQWGNSACEQQGSNSDGLYSRLMDTAITRRRNDKRFDGSSSLVDHLEDLEPTMSINLYLNYFTLEEQETKISYNRSNKEFLRAIDENRIPLELAGQMPCKFHDGCALLEIQDCRSSVSSRQRIVLQPSTESLVYDCAAIYENSTPEGESMSTEHLLEIEKQVLQRSQRLLCLDPSPNVLKVQNYVHFNARKLHLDAGDSESEKQTMSPRSRHAEVKDETVILSGSFMPSKPSRKRGLAHFSNGIFGSAKLIASDKSTISPLSQDEAGDRARAVCATISNVVPQAIKKRRKITQTIMNATTHSNLIARQKLKPAKSEVQVLAEPADPPPRRSLRFQKTVGSGSMLQLDTWKDVESGQYEGLLRFTLGSPVERGQVNSCRFHLGPASFATRFATQYKASLLKEGQICTHDSGGGPILQAPVPQPVPTSLHVKGLTPLQVGQDPAHMPPTAQNIFRNLSLPTQYRPPSSTNQMPVQQNAGLTQSPKSLLNQPGTYVHSQQPFRPQHSSSQAGLQQPQTQATMQQRQLLQRNAPHLTLPQGGTSSRMLQGTGAMPIPGSPSSVIPTMMLNSPTVHNTHMYGGTAVAAGHPKGGMLARGSPRSQGAPRQAPSSQTTLLAGTMNGNMSRVMQNPMHKGAQQPLPAPVMSSGLGANSPRAILGANSATGLALGGASSTQLGYRPPAVLSPRAGSPIAYNQLQSLPRPHMPASTAYLAASIPTGMTAVPTPTTQLCGGLSSKMTSPLVAGHLATAPMLAGGALVSGLSPQIAAQHTLQAPLIPSPAVGVPNQIPVTQALNSGTQIT